MDAIRRAREVIDIEIQGLRKVRDKIGPGFREGVDIILGRLRSGGKIVVTGIGKNLHVAQKVSAILASTGSTSVVLNPSQALHGDLGILCENDVLLAISYSGESDELTVVLPLVKRTGIPVVAITGDSASTLATHSDIVIPICVEKEACPFNLAPTSSTTATLAVGDALAMVLLEARGFREEDYAKLHPGGAIGRSLLLSVSDIMRKGDRLANVNRTATVREAVVAMTRARSGSAGVTDDEGGVAGIFTDGDLRRHLADQSNLLDLPIAEVMTPSPVTVRESQLAVDVLRLFETHKIDDLLVVDDENRLVGAVDIQDLPKLKIM